MASDASIRMECFSVLALLWPPVFKSEAREAKKVPILAKIGFAFWRKWARLTQVNVCEGVLHAVEMHLFFKKSEKKALTPALASEKVTTHTETKSKSEQAI